MLPIPTETFCHVLSNFVEKNQCGYDRVENIGFWVNITQLNKEIRRWVLWSEWGPYKLSKQKVIAILPKSPQMLRCFLGALNREKVALVDAAFKYLEAPDDHPEKSTLAGVSPLATNYAGKSLLELAISKMLKGASIESILKFFFNQVSPEQFISPVKDSFCEDSKFLISFLNLFFNERGNDHSARKALQPLLGPILAKLIYSSVPYEEVINWAHNKGVKFDLEALFCIYSVEYHTDENMDCFEKIIAFQPGIFEETNSKGERFIHIILQRPCVGIHTYVEWIFNKCPAEITAVDREGKSAISYLFKKERVIHHVSQYKMLSHMTPAILWDVREEFFTTLLQFIKKEKMKLFNRELSSVARFSNIIYDLFSEKKDLQQWLIAPYGAEQKCFLDDLIACCCEETFNLIKQAGGDIPDIAERIQSIAVLQGTDYKSKKELFPKYPGLKDQVFLSLLRHQDRHEVLNELFDSNWATHICQDGNTPLHYVFSQKPDLVHIWKPIVASMIDLGFDPHLQNSEGKSVRDLAIENGWDKLLPLLN